ncbi:hypothetical protein AAIA72_06755 [Hahella sp. SMD15-11]|jgi:hypothetical protein|uniref:Uncharacterized protein n=1 Tax=Thermohahella caldifontis TaxID=3142973 RepID=A0AB39UZF9_9GAMM
MSLTPFIRQARFTRAEKSSWQTACQLPTGCQLESRRINGLRQLAVGKGQLADHACQLEKLIDKSANYDDESSWRELSLYLQYRNPLASLTFASGFFRAGLAGPAGVRFGRTD